MTDKSNTPVKSASPPPEDEIGERIRQKRKELNLSVEQLADLTKEWDYHEGKGIPRSTLYGYESGSYKPAAREIRLLAYALNVSPTYLLLSEEWDATAELNARVAGHFAAILSEIANPVGRDNSWRDTVHDQNLRKIKGRK